MSRVKEALDRNGTQVMPGVYDALSARIAEQAGFDVIFTTGYGISATLLGEPDFGILTQTEMLSTIYRICGCGTDAGDRGLGHRLRQRGERGPHRDRAVTGGGGGHVPGGPGLAQALWSHEGQAGGATGRVSQEAQRGGGGPRGRGPLHRGPDRRAPSPRSRRGHSARYRLQGERRRRGVHRSARDPRGDAGDCSQCSGAAGGEHDRARCHAAHDAGGVEGTGFRADRPGPVGPLYSAAMALKDYYTNLREQGTGEALMDRLLPFDEFHQIVGLEEKYALDEKYRT